uniref:Uncharacterized protein n=1 Tax=Oryza meridionalis TaxID=40149 RepID=A0A0E0C312_9ORYZ
MERMERGYRQVVGGIPHRRSSGPDPPPPGTPVPFLVALHLRLAACGAQSTSTSSVAASSVSLLAEPGHCFIIGNCFLSGLLLTEPSSRAEGWDQG